MKKRLLALTLIFVALSPLQLIAATQAPLKVLAKELPVPLHASESIKSFLKLAPVPDVEGARTMTMPKTNAEWKAFVIEFDKAAVQQGIQTAKALNVKYEVSTVNGVEVYTLTPAKISDKNKNNLFLHTHGGAWLYGGNESLLREGALIAHYLNIPVLSVNYRKAPDHPAPAAVNDILTVWADLLTKRPADSVMIGGSSAGANLSAAAILRMKDLKLPLPVAAFLGTPAGDIIKNTDSRYINDGVDGTLGTWDGTVVATVEEYIRDQDPTHPYISPLYGDFTNFPPTILVSGTRDLMLSDTALMHRAIRNAGSNAELHIYEAHSHGSYFIPGADQVNLYGELADFADKYLVRYEELNKEKVTSSLKLKDILIPEDK